MTNLLIARHAEPDWGSESPDWQTPSEGKDPGLTQLGREQAELLGAWISTTQQVDAIYSSTLARARETAAIVNRHLNLDLTLTDQLREWPHPDSLPTLLPRVHSLTQIKPPFGPHLEEIMDTKYLQFAQQIHAAMSEIVSANQDKNILIIAHGHVIGQFIRTMTSSHQMLFDSDFTGVTKFSWEENRWFINYVNRSDHIKR